jgi:O-antigen/teichoic acid export membrane protein
MILVVAQIFMNGSHSPTAILYGTSKHRINALWVIGEAVANLSLSVFLVRRIGIMGVAWGTLIPSAAVSLLLRPQYVARMLKLPMRSLLWQGWIRALIAAVPYAIACSFADRFWQPHTLLGFMLQIAAILPIFVLFEAFMFWREAAPFVREWFKGLRPASAVASASGIRH